MTDYRSTDTAREALSGASQLRYELVFLAVSLPAQAANITALLRSLSYDVVVFETEADLLTAAKTRIPSYLLIHVDFENSPGNGFNVSSDFKKQAPETRIIILDNGETHMLTRLRAVRAGASGVLPLSTTASDLWTYLHNEREFLDAPARVLIIDDSMTDGFNTKRLLCRAGIEADHVQCPYDVLQRCEEMNPDLLIIDFHMPECLGDELVSALRMDRRYASLPIIFLSSESNRDRQLSAMAKGADDFITKPFQAEFLVRSVRNRVRRARKMRLLSERDSMSGLLNHASTLEALRREMSLSRLHDTPLTFAMIDIDHFKRVNDTHGHLIGDQVIRAISAFLKRNLRETDHIGRYGGEEFCVIFPQTDLNDAYGVLNRIRQTFGELPHRNTEGEIFTVTFSAGLVTFDGNEDMTYWADQALYQAKRDGRNTIRTISCRLPTANSV